MLVGVEGKASWWGTPLKIGSADGSDTIHQERHEGNFHGSWLVGADTQRTHGYKVWRARIARGEGDFRPGQRPNLDFAPALGNQHDLQAHHQRLSINLPTSLTAKVY